MTTNRTPQIEHVYCCCNTAGVFAIFLTVEEAIACVETKIDSYPLEIYDVERIKRFNAIVAYDVYRRETRTLRVRTIQNRIWIIKVEIGRQYKLAIQYFQD